MENHGFLVQLCCAAMYMIVLLLSALWVFRDAQRRGSSGCLIALLVFFTWPIGIFLWILLRPKGSRYW